jgi:hypothetical protein
LHFWELLMIKPIETVYNGYRFRSRLEARWAVFFDTLGIKYEYEKEGYDLDGVWYLPDFWLPGVSLRGGKDGIWCEIKSEQPTKGEERLCQLLNKSTGFGAVLVVGLPSSDADAMYQELYDWWDNCMLWCKCYGCGYIKVEFSEGNYMECPRCKADCDDDHPDIVAAYGAAKSAHFEHGEHGAPRPHTRTMNTAAVHMGKLDYAKCPQCDTKVWRTEYGILLDDRTMREHTHAAG